MSNLAEMISVDCEWLAEREASWRRLERKFGGLIIQFSGLGFASLIVILTAPLPTALVCIFATLLLACTVMLCLCSQDVENCRRWLDWHAEMRADPYAWPWPPLPNE